jgi:secreted Zn-dependent insulinase-like peptidase
MRDYKKDYKNQLLRDEHENRMERQRARRKLDAKGIDRKGKDVAHVKALSKGGSNATGIRLESPSKNRSFKRNPDSSMK